MKRKQLHLQAYPFILLLAALTAGIVLQDNLPQLSPEALIGLFGFLLLISLLLQWFSIKATAGLSSRNILLLLTFCAFGATLSYFQDIKNHQNWFGTYLKQTEALKVTITENPVIKPKTILLNVNVTAFAIHNQWQNCKGNASIYVYRKNLNTVFKQGQTLLIPNRLKAIQHSGNPFAFDRKAFCNRKGLYHQGFFAPDKIITLSGPDISPDFIDKLRSSILNAIETNVRDSSTKALMKAITVNDRTDIQDELKNTYSQTGIIHIIAISGMHVLLLASILLMIIGKIPFRKIQKCKYALALILVWMYISITGLPPSAVRAAVMFTIYAFGKMLNKESRPVNTWAVAGFLLLCYNPFWLYDVGFQLSFMAVLSILLFSKTISSWWRPRYKLLRYLWESVAISIAVQILVFPIVIYYFHQFPITVFIANIPAALFATFLMCAGIAICSLHALGLPSSWIGTVSEAVTDTFNNFIALLSRLSPESFRTLYLDKIDYWILMSAIILICCFCYFKKVQWLITGLICAMFLVISFIRKDWETLHTDRIVVYNLNNKSMTDIFKGKAVYHSDTYDASDDKYVLAPARLGFRTNKEIQPSPRNNDIFLINGKKILKLEAGLITGTQPFPVDVLIVNNRCVFDPHKWHRIFHPKKIIIDGSLPEWKALQWTTTLQQAGANVHWVKESGAWIYPEITL